MDDVKFGIPGLDPDDPRPASQQIANHLRAAISTRRFEPGAKLPSQPELAGRYGVARETVKAAFRILAGEKLIVVRQGSGAFVRARAERPVELRPYIERSFEAENVTIDFAGFSGETLQGLLAQPLDKVRAGTANPRSIIIRMLVPDMSHPTEIPSRADTGEDDPALRERAQRIASRSRDAIRDAMSELAELGLVDNAEALVRVHRGTPQFKLYVLNSEDVFFGFYPVVRRSVTILGKRMSMFDVLGKDVPLTHFSTGDDETSEGSQYVHQAQMWFESVWSTIGRTVPA